MAEGSTDPHRQAVPAVPPPYRRPATVPRRQERHSFYLDGELAQRIDATYREVAHQLHPQTVSKSVFLETLLEFGLDRLLDLTTAVQKKAQA